MPVYYHYINILALFHIILHHFIFISWPFLGIFGTFPGISDKFYHNVYCPEEYLHHFTSFHAVTHFLSFLFLGSFWAFLAHVLAFLCISHMRFVVLNSLWAIFNHLALFYFFTFISWLFLAHFYGFTDFLV